MFEISWFQAALLGVMSVLAGSTPAALGTTVGNYTLNRPLIGGLFVGLILGDVPGAIQVAIPMQVVYIALVTPGGTVSADLRAVSYIGIPLAYAAVKGAGVNFADVEAVKGLAAPIAALVGTVGTVMFYGTAMMNLVWQHYGWAQLDKGNFKVLPQVEVFLPLITHFVISFIPTMLMVYYGTSAVQEIQKTLPMDGLFMKTMFTVGSILPAVGIAILLKSVVDKTTDLIPFFFGFVLSKSLGLGLVAASLVGAIFALFNYKIEMMKAETANNAYVDDEEDI